MTNKSSSKDKKVSKAFNKIVVGLVISLLITLPATAVSINMKTNSSNTFGDPPIFMLGDTIIVDDDGTGDYTTIQAAINNAATGDYIIVKDGTYDDQLTINVPGLTISAASGETPTIYVSSYDVGIDVTASNVLFEGFEIFGNGSLTGGPFPTIRANTGANGLNINDNHFKVFTGEIGQIALMINSGVIGVKFTSNIITGYENSLYHAALIIRTDTYYGSIQDAIDLAIAGDVISVASGTYDERLVIGTQVTLNGNSQGTILQPTTVPAPGVYDVEIDASGTIIQNFNFDFNGPTDIRSGNGIVVSDLNDPPVTDVVIQSNTIYTGHTNTGIQTGKNSDVSNLLINYNTFYADIDGMGEGVYVNPFLGDDEVTISNNEFYGNLYSAISIEANNVTAFRNTIDSNVSKGIYGVRFIELTGGQIFSGVIISENNIKNVTYGIRVGTTTDVGSVLTASITNNDINFNDVGVWVQYGANLSNSVIDNSLDNNTDYGINNIGNTLVDATNNWWGHISGPYHPIDNPTGTGTNVTDNVTYWPWYEFDGYSIPPIIETKIGLPQAEGGLYVSDLTSFELKGTDIESGMKSLTYRLWNATHRWSPWYDFIDDFTLSGDGKHLIEVNATDVAGTKTVELQTHYVDTVPPSAEVLYPNGGEYLHGSVEIEWNAADKIPDQEQIYWNNYWPLTNDYPGHIQSFVPTEETMNSVWLQLNGDGAEVTVILFSDIEPIPIPLAQTSTQLQDIGDVNDPEWVEFSFGSDIILVPDITYYIGVTQIISGSTGFNWYYYNSTGLSDQYPNGQSWLKKTATLELQPECDWTFRTTHWNTDITVDIQYSNTGGFDWVNLAVGQENDGSYIWNTIPYPDSLTYKIRVAARDVMDYIGADESDEVFFIDNTGPVISDVTITDTTIANTEYTTDGDDIEITAVITGDPYLIEADLTEFGGGSAVPPTTYSATIATWDVPSIVCSPSDGPIEVTIVAEDLTGDISGGTGSITADNTPPEIEITRPLLGIYLFDSQRLLPYPYPLVIGPITIKLDSDDIGSGIEKIEFYKKHGIETTLMETITEQPYEWLWNERAFGFYQIKVVVYDNVGLNATAQIDDIFMFNFGRTA